MDKEIKGTQVKVHKGKKTDKGTEIKVETIKEAPKKENITTSAERTQKLKVEKVLKLSNTFDVNRIAAMLGISKFEVEDILKQD